MQKTAMNQTFDIIKLKNFNNNCINEHKFINGTKTNLNTIKFPSVSTADDSHRCSLGSNSDNVLNTDISCNGLSNSNSSCDKNMKNKNCKNNKNNGTVSINKDNSNNINNLNLKSNKYIENNNDINNKKNSTDTNTIESEISNENNINIEIFYQYNAGDVNTPLKDKNNNQEKKPKEKKKEKITIVSKNSKENEIKEKNSKNNKKSKNTTVEKKEIKRDIITNEYTNDVNTLNKEEKNIIYENVAKYENFVKYNEEEKKLPIENEKKKDLNYDDEEEEEDDINDIMNNINKKRYEEKNNEQNISTEEEYNINILKKGHEKEKSIKDMNFIGENKFIQNFNRFFDFFDQEEKKEDNQKCIDNISNGKRNKNMKNSSNTEIVECTIPSIKMEKEIEKNSTKNDNKMDLNANQCLKNNLNDINLNMKDNKFVDWSMKMKNNIKINMEKRNTGNFLSNEKVCSNSNKNNFIFKNNLTHLFENNERNMHVLNEFNNRNKTNSYVYDENKETVQNDTYNLDSMYLDKTNKNSFIYDDIWGKITDTNYFNSAFDVSSEQDKSKQKKEYFDNNFEDKIGVILDDNFDENMEMMHDYFYDLKNEKPFYLKNEKGNKNFKENGNSDYYLDAIKNITNSNGNPFFNNSNSVMKNDYEQVNKGNKNMENSKNFDVNLKNGNNDLLNYILSSNLNNNNGLSEYHRNANYYLKNNTRENNNLMNSEYVSDNMNYRKNGIINNLLTNDDCYKAFTSENNKNMFKMTDNRKSFNTVENLDLNHNFNINDSTGMLLSLNEKLEHKRFSNPTFKVTDNNASFYNEEEKRGGSEDNRTYKKKLNSIPNILLNNNKIENADELSALYNCDDRQLLNNNNNPLKVVAKNTKSLDMNTNYISDDYFNAFIENMNNGNVQNMSNKFINDYLNENNINKTMSNYPKANGFNAEKKVNNIEQNVLYNSSNNTSFDDEIKDADDKKNKNSLAKYTLIVNVPSDTTRKDLTSVFSKFGNVNLTMVVCDKQSRHPNKEWTATSGYAFVRFSSNLEAQRTLNATSSGLVRIRGSRVRATWAKKDSYSKREKEVAFKIPSSFLSINVEEFICVLCKVHLSYNPKLFPCCFSACCSDCLTNYIANEKTTGLIKCPVCSTMNSNPLIKIDKSSKGVMALLYKLHCNIKVKCPKENCNWVGAQYQYFSHIDSCKMQQNTVKL